MVSSRFSYGFVFCCCCFSNLQVVHENGKVVVTVATTQKGNSNGDWKCNFGSRQAVEVIILVIYNIIFCSKKCGVTGKPGWFY